MSQRPTVESRRENLNKRFSPTRKCRNCSADQCHSYKECTKNQCTECKEYGHIKIDCKNRCVRGTPWKFEEFVMNTKGYRADGVPCGCDEKTVKDKRETNSKSKIPYQSHCCHCKGPYPMRVMTIGSQYEYICFWCREKEGLPGSPYQKNVKRPITPPESPRPQKIQTVTNEELIDEPEPENNEPIESQIQWEDQNEATTSVNTFNEQNIQMVTDEELYRNKDTFEQTIKRHFGEIPECEDCGKKSKGSSQSFGFFEGSLCDKCQERRNKSVENHYCHICNTVYEYEGENNGCTKGSRDFKRFCSIECKYAHQVYRDCYQSNYNSIKQAIHEFSSKVHGYALRIINRNNGEDYDQYEKEIFDLLFNNEYRPVTGLPVTIRGRRTWISKQTLYRSLNIVDHDEDFNIMPGDITIISREQFQAQDIDSVIPTYKISEEQIMKNLNLVNQAMCTECQYTASKEEIEYYLGICAECSAEKTIKAEISYKESSKGKEKDQDVEMKQDVEMEKPMYEKPIGPENRKSLFSYSETVAQLRERIDVLEEENKETREKMKKYRSLARKYMILNKANREMVINYGRCITMNIFQINQSNEWMEGAYKQIQEKDKIIEELGQHVLAPLLEETIVSQPTEININLDQLIENTNSNQVTLYDEITGEEIHVDKDFYFYINNQPFEQ